MAATRGNCHRGPMLKQWAKSLQLSCFHDVRVAAKSGSADRPTAAGPVRAPFTPPEPLCPTQDRRFSPHYRRGKDLRRPRRPEVLLQARPHVLPKHLWHRISTSIGDKPSPTSSPVVSWPLILWAMRYCYRNAGRRSPPRYLRSFPVLWRGCNAPRPGLRWQCPAI